MLGLRCPGTVAVAGNMVARVNVQNLSCGAGAALRSGPRQEEPSDRSSFD